MDKRPSSPYNDDYLLEKSPTCCELVSPKGGVLVTSILQIILLISFISAFIWMESQSFFHSNSPLRLIISIISTIYLFSVFCTMIGCIASLPSVLSLSTHLLQSFIFFTDLIAISVVVCMAIGNRNEWLDTLPSRIVNVPRFEKTLGPFWMYLSAIALHITVAANVCFMQSINFCLKTMANNDKREGRSEERSQSTENTKSR